MKVKDILYNFIEETKRFIHNDGEEDTQDYDNKDDDFYIMFDDSYFRIDMDSSYWILEDDGTVVFRVNDDWNTTTTKTVKRLLEDYGYYYYQYTINQNKANEYKQAYNDMYNDGLDEQDFNCHAYAICFKTYQHEATHYDMLCHRTYCLLEANYCKSEYNDDIKLIHEEYKINK